MKANLARALCQAVSQSVEGLQGRVKSASISGGIDEVTLITVTFMPTNEQMQAIGKFLGESPVPRAYMGGPVEPGKTYRVGE